MNAEQKIKQIADEAIEKIKAIRAEKDEWPENGDLYLWMNGKGVYQSSRWCTDEDDKALKARRRIAPNTPEGRARLERLAEWEVFFADFMTAGDAELGNHAHFVECSYLTSHIYFIDAKYGCVGQRGFTTWEKRDEWLNKWGRDYVEKMLKGGMP